MILRVSTVYGRASEEAIEQVLWMLRLIRFVGENPSVGDPYFSVRVRSAGE